MRDRNGNNVPALALAFAQWLEQHGWHYLREYVPAGEYVDEDGATVHYGPYWEQMIWHEFPPAWPREEGHWFYCVTVTDAMVAHEQLWPTFLDFCNLNSETERTSCRVPFAFTPSVGASSDGASE